MPTTVTSQANVYRDRLSFAKLPEVMDIPNLISIQVDSFNNLMTEGLDETFASMSPIENSAKTLCVEFGAHEFGDPKHSVEECKKRDISYQAPLFVDIRFINKETGEAALDVEGMKTMRNLGRNMAWLLKSIEAGRAAGVPAPEVEGGSWMNFIR